MQLCKMYCLCKMQVNWSPFAQISRSNMLKNDQKYNLILQNGSLEKCYELKNYSINFILR